MSALGVGARLMMMRGLPPVCLPVPVLPPFAQWPQIQYDIAVVAVGEQPATFNVPGVRENCYFMKVRVCLAVAPGAGRR
jgi:hypothetical protein